MVVTACSSVAAELFVFVATAPTAFARDPAEHLDADQDAVAVLPPWLAVTAMGVPVTVTVPEVPIGARAAEPVAPLADGWACPWTALRHGWNTMRHAGPGSGRERRPGDRGGSGDLGDPDACPAVRGAGELRSR